MALAGEHLDEVLLQLEPGVVGADGDARHQPSLRSALPPDELRRCDVAGAIAAHSSVCVTPMPLDPRTPVHHRRRPVRSSTPTASTRRWTRRLLMCSAIGDGQRPTPGSAVVPDSAIDPRRQPADLEVRRPGVPDRPAPRARRPGETGVHHDGRQQPAGAGQRHAPTRSRPASSTSPSSPAARRGARACRARKAERELDWPTAPEGQVPRDRSATTST